jgi:hypothetical protein
VTTLKQILHVAAILFLRAYLLVGTRRGRVITFQAVIWRDPGVGPAADGPGMGIYDFEVLKDDTVIAAKQAIALPDARAAWPKVAELAKTFNQPWAQNLC